MRDADPVAGISACTRLIQRGDPANAADSYANRGRFYAAQNELDRALADLDEALRLNPRIADAQYNRGYCYALQGHYDKALAALDQSIRLDPAGAAESYHLRGRIYADMGEIDAAMEAFNAAHQSRSKAR